MDSAQKIRALGTTVAFMSSAAAVAAGAILLGELSARSDGLPSGIGDRGLHIFALQMFAALLAGHLASAVKLGRTDLTRMNARWSALAGFCAMALLMIMLMLAGAQLGVAGRMAVAFGAGAMATGVAFSSPRALRAASTPS